MGRRAHLPKVYVYFLLHRILHLLTILQTLKICSHRPRSTTCHPRFADLSTCVLESANWNLPQPTTLGSSFPNLATTLGLRIRALPCSILQNRVPLRTHHSRSCKFERASARIGKTEPPRPPLPPVLQIRARKCSNWQNRASPPTYYPRFCKFEHASAQIGKTESPCASTTLGPANSSAQVLELAKPGVPSFAQPTTPSVLQIRVRKCSNWQNRASPPTYYPPVLQIRARKCSNWQNRVSPPLPNQPLPSVLQIRVRKCSNWQNRASPPTYSPRFCKFERASARIGKTKSPCAPTTLGSANSSAQVLELAIPGLPAHHPHACHPPPSFRPVRARKCLNWPNRASSRSPNPPSFRKTDPLFK